MTTYFYQSMLERNNFGISSHFLLFLAASNLETKTNISSFLATERVYVLEYLYHTKFLILVAAFWKTELLLYIYRGDEKLYG